MAGEDPQYTAWLRTRRCTVSGADGHRGPVQAHHDNTRAKGMGMRSHDHRAIPFCAHHHRCWHDHSQYFKGWDRDRRRAWVDHTVLFYRGMYESEQATRLIEKYEDWDNIF